MFCRLFELHDMTALKLADEIMEHCGECQYKKSDQCTVCKDTNVRLNKNKFGWLIDVKIDIVEPRPSKSKNTFYRWAFRMIHPTNSDVWILKSYKKDAATFMYSYYFGTNRHDCDTIEELNNKLITEGYNGREIANTDF